MTVEDSADMSKDMQFFIVSVATGKEKLAQRGLMDRVEFSGATDDFGDVIVPEESVVEIRKAKKVKVIKKRMPGYVFVQMVMSRRNWDIVNDTPHVLAFVGGTRGKPLPMAAGEVDRLLKREGESARVASASESFRDGEHVKVIEGPFAGLDGQVQHVDVKRGKIKVGLMVFGQQLPVDLEIEKVAKA